MLQQWREEKNRSGYKRSNGNMAFINYEDCLDKKFKEQRKNMFS